MGSARPGSNPGDCETTPWGPLHSSHETKERPCTCSSHVRAVKESDSNVTSLRRNVDGWTRIQATGAFAFAIRTTRRWSTREEGGTDLHATSAENGRVGSRVRWVTRNGGMLSTCMHPAIYIEREAGNGNSTPS